MNRLRAIALTTTLSLGISHETPSIFEGASHIPPGVCREDVIASLGSYIGQAVQIDIENSIDANKPTKPENDARTNPEDIKHHPTIEKFINSSEIISEQYVLPRSGFIVNLHRIQNSWKYSPEAHEAVWHEALSNTFEDDPLRSATYNCYRREVFENGLLRGYSRDFYVIGEGLESGDENSPHGYCLSRDRIIPRQLEPNLCTAIGRERKDFVLLLPTTPIRASESMIHEGMHAIQGATGSESPNRKHREHAAYGLADLARRYMEDSGDLIFRPN